MIVCTQIKLKLMFLVKLIFKVQKKALILQLIMFSHKNKQILKYRNLKLILKRLTISFNKIQSKVYYFDLNVILQIQRIQMKRDNTNRLQITLVILIIIFKKVKKKRKMKKHNIASFWRKIFVIRLFKTKQKQISQTNLVKVKRKLNLIRKRKDQKIKKNLTQIKISFYKWSRKNIKRLVSKSQKTLMMKNLRSLKEVVAGVQVVMKKFIIKLLLKNWAIYFQQSINYLLIQLKTLLVVLQQSIILAMKMMGFFFKMF